MIKVSIIGAGTIGSAIAYLLAQKGYYNLYLIEKPGVYHASQKALDIMESLTILGSSIAYTIKGSDNIQDIKNSDILIIAADDHAQGPEKMTNNSEIIDSIAESAKEHAPNAFVIVVTNPVDAMTWKFQKSSDFPEHRVIGLSGVLNAGSLRYLLSSALGVDVRDIHTAIIGTHDQNMIPLLGYTTVSGMPLIDYMKQHNINEEKINSVIETTKVISKDHLCFAPAAAVLQMIESYIFDQKRILTCSVNMNMTEPESDVCLGLPVVIG